VQREPEQAQAGVWRGRNASKRIYHRLEARVIGRNSKDSKRFPTKLPFVQLGCVRSKISAHFPREAGLADVAS
jgi:hypothetical protein